MSTASNFFVTGGTVPANAPSYVERKADTDLLTALLNGDYCFVLNSRQMGKSSLSVRTIGKLEGAGVQTAFLDLTRIGAQNVTAEQWYAGLLAETGRALEHRSQVLAFWRANTHLPPVQRFFTALRDVLLEAIPEPLCIFVDEIDAVRSLSFPADEFFAAVRACYNSRTQDDVYKRLTFCLVGAATPADLISDTRMSPFNVGRRIELRDFTPSEAAPLAEHLPGGKPTLDRILHWTGGQPYLTQRLCRAVVEEPGVSVDQLCDGLFLAKSAQESDDNISFVRNRLLKSEVDLASLLDLYGKVRSGKKVRDDETNPLCGVLRLSGACKLDKDYLVIRNRIYDHVFDKNWVLSHMPDAELRRQKEAYRRGLIRAAALGGVVSLGMAGLTGWAIRNAQNTIKAKKQTEKAKELAESYFANANLQLAAQTWESENGSAESVRSLLGDYQPDSRVTNSFAWRLLWTQLNQGSGDSLAFPASGSRVIGSAFLGDGSLWTLNLGGILTHYPANQTATNKTIALSKLVPNANTNAYALSPKGNVAFVGTKDGKVAVVDIASQKVLRWLTVEGETSPIDWLTVAPEGDNIVAVDATGRWLVWKQESEKLLHNIPFNVPGLAFIESPQSLLVTSGPSPRLAFRESFNYFLLPSTIPATLPNAEAVKRLGQHFGQARNAAGDLVPVGKLRHDSSGRGMALSSEGTKAATTDANGRVIAWDLKTNQGILQIDAHATRVAATIFSHDGKQLATSGEDGSVRVWDARTGTLLRSFKGQMATIRYLSFSPDDAYLISADDEGGSRRWPLKESTSFLQTKAGAIATVDTNSILSTSNSRIQSQQFSSDGKQLLVANNSVLELAVSPQRLTQERVLFKSQRFRSAAEAKAFLKLPATATQAEVRAAWEKQTFKQLREIYPCYYARFTPNGRSIVCAVAGGLVTYDRVTGKEKAAWQLRPMRSRFEGSISCFTFAPDGKSLVVGFGLRTSMDSNHAQTVAVVDASTGKEVQTLTGFQNHIYDVTFSPDGKTLAIACHDGTLSFYQKKGKDWALTYRRETPNLKPTSLAFSPSGKLLAVGKETGGLELLDATKPTYPMLHSLLGHSNFRLVGLAFSPDGSTLASSCWDQTVKLWDTVTGRELRTLYGHKNWVMSVAFSPDGNTLVSGDADGRLLLRHAVPASQIAQTEESKLLKRVFKMQETEKVDTPLLTKFLARYPDDTEAKRLYTNALLAPQRLAAREALARKDYPALAKAHLAIFKETWGPGDCLNATSALLLAGDTKGYRQLCNEILDNLEKTTGGSAINNSSFLLHCSLTPAGFLANPTAFRRFVDYYRQRSTSNALASWHVAAGLYRLGEYQQALALLQKEDANPSSFTDRDYWIAMRSYSLRRSLFFACTYAKLGKPAEAKAAYQKATTLYKELKGDPSEEALWVTMGKETRGLLKLPEPAGP